MMASARVGQCQEIARQSLGSASPPCMAIAALIAMPIEKPAGADQPS
jgi:hypothetical protein